MVASGIPVPNGLHHAVELSKMALDLLAKVLTFEIKHKPQHRLKLRMGMHSGQVVGGVVGSKIPHYSVFGDTVELASLMESSGMPMKIQITPATKVILCYYNPAQRQVLIPKIYSTGYSTGGWNIQLCCQGKCSSSINWQHLHLLVDWKKRLTRLLILSCKVLWIKMMITQASSALFSSCKTMFVCNNNKKC